MNGKDKFYADLIERYEKRLSNYRIIIIVLIAVSVFLFPFILQSHIKTLSSPKSEEVLEEPAELKQSIDIPYYDQVMKIIGGLSYSGLQTLIKPTVKVKIDFENKSWSLVNLHSFDAEGHVLLEENRYGLCGELSDYVYRKIKPIFGDQYTFLFTRVAEVGYFLNPRSSHTVIQIINKANPNEIFVIDPSFSKYALIEDFGDYVFHETIEHVEFLPDPVFEVPSSTPVLIKRHFIVDLGVEGTNDKFDNNNFTIALSATRQYHFTGRFIFALRLKEGVIQKVENLALSDWLLDRKSYLKLRTQIIYWFAANDQIPDTPENSQIIKELLKSIPQTTR